MRGVGAGRWGVFVGSSCVFSPCQRHLLSPYLGGGGGRLAGLTARRQAKRARLKGGNMCSPVC